MDTFFEQIISIKKTGKTIAGIIGILFLALIICFVIFIFSGYLGSFAFLLMLGVGYGAFKLICQFNVEYEYIVTNGTMDIDKILNRSSRKRILSFELSTVSRLEKYNKGLISNINPKDVVFACNETDDSYLMVYQKEGKSAVYVVFAPNDKIKNAIVKFLPKFIANSAFK